MGGLRHRLSEIGIGIARRGKAERTSQGLLLSRFATGSRWREWGFEPPVPPRGSNQNHDTSEPVCARRHMECTSAPNRGPRSQWSYDIDSRRPIITVLGGPFGADRDPPVQGFSTSHQGGKPRWRGPSSVRITARRLRPAPRGLGSGLVGRRNLLFGGRRDRAEQAVGLPVGTGRKVKCVGI